MQFPNAFAGIKDIYSAAILSLVSAALGIIIVIAAVTGSTSFVAILGIIVALVAIVASVSNIVGIVKAPKDEAAFKKALYALLVSIVVTLLGNFIKSGLLSSLFDVLVGICSFLVTYMICQGIVNLADQLGDTVVSESGKWVMKLEIIVWAISIVATLISAILGGSAAVVGGILFLASSIVSIVAYILYLGLLGKAKKMLA